LKYAEDCGLFFGVWSMEVIASLCFPDSLCCNHNLHAGYV
jgi:hypothetical protein